MKFSATVALAILGLAAQQTLAVESVEAVEPLIERSEAIQARDIGCYQQGTSSRPAMCYKPNCPSNRRSVFWDFGCPSGAWKCCI
ncbi:hypothetical protein N7499_004947 [Penicillium canescens]|uniref:Uncharacterized protein n=1 Tax=Penicillium canescens TaxID=5083 RepID=A0AAD6N371_PENCN|nr:uncharacterized protein N7446_004555 [Penicillium canescens]KAJ6009655.1 hypothetical protein N7522_004671 [Penicillium canescens]KAJ6026845.1 hypothetical protein N7460_011662 [Penicillium canescens]KAJ6040131.1 hypothetical protein N7444_009036 [Penicillium canescens]KAJ6067518.1 hypothetical protein N7446_004555 [Penicillium canescens]KAJ6085318.1 hypothetical protein N7499_004947 [Penicillium canescens]